MIALVALVLFKLNKESSVLTVFIITLIFNYLNGLALSSIPGKCNPFHNKYIDKNNFLYSSLLHIILNTALATLAITYRSLSTKTSKNMESISLNKNTNEEDQEDKGYDNLSKSISKENIIIKGLDNEADEEAQLKKNGTDFMKFHIAMMLISIYLGSLIENSCLYLRRIEKCLYNLLEYLFHV